MARLRRIIIDSDDELPDIVVGSNQRHEDTPPPEASISTPPRDAMKKQHHTMRRRKLGQPDGYSLLLGKGGSEIDLPNRQQFRDDNTGLPQRRHELQAARARKAASISQPGNGLVKEQPVCSKGGTLDSSDPQCANTLDGNRSDDEVASTPHSTSPTPVPSTKVRIPRSLDSRRPREGWEKKGLGPGSLLYSSDDSAEDQLSLAHLSLRSEESMPSRPRTPPAIPAEAGGQRGLKSPSKNKRISQIPHSSDTDPFWDRNLVDDWNMQHSPSKPLRSATGSPSKQTPRNVNTSRAETRKIFQNAKDDIARAFLGELDDIITQGRLAEFTESTGGIKITWTRTLNTTAGRANWKREALRSKPVDATADSVRYRHHASIELAEKVIGDENQLLNVIAHEFCHLCNFIISGVTGNPHGKEFKEWAAKVSRAFSHRGIKVTTKHSYDIDFKYIWECNGCGCEFKRHSKSIDPSRHRCGSCKEGRLQQTKPRPRAGTTSAYQDFVKEHMGIVKKEYPASPQKEILKIIASRWSQRATQESAQSSTTGVDQVAAALVGLSLTEGI